MAVFEKESQTIRRFVCQQLRGEPDLSTLTIRILKRRYLEYVGHESLTSEAKHFMKQVVEEELVKMQGNDCNESNSEAKVPQKKRKREEESDGVVTESEDESRAKKSHRVSSSSSESEDEKESKTASDASEDEEQIKNGSGGAKKKTETSKKKTNKAAQQQISSDDFSDEETKEAQMDDEGLEKNGGSTKEPRRKKENTVMNGKRKSSKTSEDESDSDSKSEKSAKRDSNESSDDDEDNNEKEGHVTVEKRDEDSDSSSLPSVEDDEEADEPKKKKTKAVTEKENIKSERDRTKMVVKLKYYITVCGVRRNYKKLFENCHSIRSQVAVLKKELEDLGVKGRPTIEKCKKIRMERETAQEIAELDVNNIICSQGRSKRRSVLNERQKSPSSTYQRTLCSGSDSDQENKTQRRTTDWGNLQGIISDDADSD